VRHRGGWKDKVGGSVLPDSAQRQSLQWPHVDPIGGNLDRFQIVKGWQAGNGELKETVNDVVWSDAAQRKRGPDAKLPATNAVCAYL
jgi:hypothetical protein